MLATYMDVDLLLAMAFRRTISVMDNVCCKFWVPLPRSWEGDGRRSKSYGTVVLFTNSLVHLRMDGQRGVFL